MSSPAPVRQRPDFRLAEVIFAAGAVLVIVAFIYSVGRGWTSFDPLAMATLVGIGLLLVVICDRLGGILREVREIRALMASGRRGPGRD